MGNEYAELMSQKTILTKAHNYLKLPGWDRWVFTKIIFYMGFIRLAILVIPFHHLWSFLERYTQGNNIEIKAEDQRLAKRVGELIELGSRNTPWNSNCLTQAVTGKLLLSGYKIPTIISFGVVKESDELNAHAWLSLGDVVITGNEGLDKYTVVGELS